MLAVLVCLSPSAFGQDEEEAELAAVRERLVTLQARLAEDMRRRADGAAELERTERTLGDLERRVAELTADVTAEEQREATLGAAAEVAEARLGAEEDLLAEQIRLSYRTGRQELFTLLLSQEDPASLGRMLVWYDYLNRARGRRIDGVNDELAELARVRREAREAREASVRLRDARARELESLAAVRVERERALDRLDASIANAGGEIERLQAEESRLTELVAELARLMEGFPVGSEAPFSSWRGRLSWPLEAEVANDFGQLREGGPLRWNGVVLRAPAGEVVRAVYHGRVAFADWLPGLGLLLVIDHGEQYMSLYGHNEALLHVPGDWVAPGEPIARVGDTGGRREPALYFEIRRDGEPENPHDWIP